LPEDATGDDEYINADIEKWQQMAEQERSMQERHVVSKKAASPVISPAAAAAQLRMPWASRMIQPPKRCVRTIRYAAQGLVRLDVPNPSPRRMLEPRFFQTQGVRTQAGYYQPLMPFQEKNNASFFKRKTVVPSGMQSLPLHSSRSRPALVAVLVEPNTPSSPPETRARDHSGMERIANSVSKHTEEATMASDQAESLGGGFGGGWKKKVGKLMMVNKAVSQLGFLQKIVADVDADIKRDREAAAQQQRLGGERGAQARASVFL